MNLSLIRYSFIEQFNGYSGIKIHLGISTYAGYHHHFYHEMRKEFKHSSQKSITRIISESYSNE